MRRQDMIPNPDDPVEVEIWKKAWQEGRLRFFNYYDASRTGREAVVTYRRLRGLSYDEARTYIGGLKTCP